MLSSKVAIIIKAPMQRSCDPGIGVFALLRKSVKAKRPPLTGSPSTNKGFLYIILNAVRRGGQPLPRSWFILYHTLTAPA